MMIGFRARNNLHHYAELREHIHDDVANQIKIYAVAIGANAQRRLLMRQISRLTLGDVEYGRDLIEHCVFVIAVLVEGNRTQHAWHKGTAHDAGIFSRADWSA